MCVREKESEIKREGERERGGQRGRELVIRVLALYQSIRALEFGEPRIFFAAKSTGLYRKPSTPT